MSQYEDNYEENDDQNGSKDNNYALIILLWVILFPIMLLLLLITHLIDKKHERVAVDEAYIKGFEKASEIYEKKFRAQTEEFLSFRKSCKEDFDLYEQLLEEYDKTINDIQRKLLKSKADPYIIDYLLKKKKELLDLQEVS